jgi:hypothetical protein
MEILRGLITFLGGMVTSLLLLRALIIYRDYKSRQRFAILLHGMEKERKEILTLVLAEGDKVMEGKQPWSVMGLGAYLLAKSAKTCGAPRSAALEFLALTWAAVKEDRHGIH